MRGARVGWLLTMMATTVALSACDASTPAVGPHPHKEAQRCDRTLPVYLFADSAVQFLSPRIGWAILGSELLATSDGGRRWQVRQRLHTGEITGLDFIDRSHGWALGPRALEVTDSGGRQWTQLREPCGGLEQVDFLTADTGYAIGRDGALGALLTTRNGGRSWARLAAPADAQSVCLTGQDGWLGAHGSIYRTDNSGRTWALSLPDPAGTQSASTSGALVQCAGGSGWAELQGEGVAMESTPHAGFHFAHGRWRALFGDDGYPKSDMAFLAGEQGPFSVVSPSTAVFAGSCPACTTPGSAPVTPYPPGGTKQGDAPLAVVTDGTRLRTRGPIGMIEGATGLSFVSASEGWAVGRSLFYLPQGDGRSVSYIMHTTDGGQTWYIQLSRRLP